MKGSIYTKYCPEFCKFVGDAFVGLSQSTYFQKIKMGLLDNILGKARTSVFQELPVHSGKVIYIFLCFAEQLSCLFQLKSATEGSNLESDSAVCLHPGSGDYHVL